MVVLSLSLFYFFLCVGNIRRFKITSTHLLYTYILSFIWFSMWRNKQLQIKIRFYPTRVYNLTSNCTQETNEYIVIVSERFGRFSITRNSRFSKSPQHYWNESRRIETATIAFLGGSDVNLVRGDSCSPFLRLCRRRRCHTDGRARALLYRNRLTGAPWQRIACSFGKRRWKVYASACGSRDRFNDLDANTLFKLQTWGPSLMKAIGQTAHIVQYVVKYIHEMQKFGWRRTT